MSELSRIKISTPEYDEILPSTQEAIKIRPFRVADEKTLLIASESKDTKQMANAMKKIVGNCVLNDIDVNNLATHDFEYLFIKIRAKSVGEVSKLKLACQHCQTDNTVDFDLEGVKIREEEGFSNILKINDTLAFQMKNIGLDDVLKVGPNSNTSEMFSLIGDAVDVIVHEDETFTIGKAEKKDVMDIIESLPSSDFVKFIDYFGSLPHVYGEVNFTCSSCGKENEQELKGIQNFF